MKKSLCELAAEYDQSIAAMLECVQKIKNERRQARQEGDADRLKMLSSKLYTVYEEIRDMKIVAETLRNYYNVESIREVCA